MGIQKINICPVCGSVHRELLYSDTLQGASPRFNYAFSPEHNKTYQMLRCLGCHHVYSSLLPEDLWANYIDVIDEVYLKDQESRCATARKVVGVISKFCPQGRLLDVGCATGDFLSVAREKYDVEGLELSVWSSAVARTRGFMVCQERLSRMQGEGVFDAVTLWGVIEHFEEPRLELSHIHRLLKSGGVVCLWTGDVDCFLSRIMGRKWWYVQGQHLQLFSRRSLRRLFDDAGFKEEWMGRYPYILSIEAISRSLGRYPLIHRLLGWVGQRVFLRHRMLTMALPGEMFCIFRKL